jgi:hypothetical protein
MHQNYVLNMLFHDHSPLPLFKISNLRDWSLLGLALATSIP